jgi:hypothetical protein
VLVLSAGIAIVAGLASKFILAPMRARLIDETNARGTPTA